MPSKLSESTVRMSDKFYDHRFEYQLLFGVKARFFFRDFVSSATSAIMEKS